jgi:hypothetical protein
MKDTVYQAITDPVIALPPHATSSTIAKPPTKRSLKIEAAGDFFKRKVIPKIRLSGKWLEQAGFKPGHRVELDLVDVGEVTLRFVESKQEVRELQNRDRKGTDIFYQVNHSKCK